MGIESDDMDLWSCIHCGKFLGQLKAERSYYNFRDRQNDEPDPEVCPVAFLGKHKFKF